MATVDFSRYRRIVQKLWDPEPTNDAKADQPAWCLGSSYTLATDVLSHEIDVTPSVSSSKASQIDSRSSIGSNPSPEQPAEDPAGSQPLTRHTKYAGGDDWRRSGDVTHEKSIIALFADDERAPYSIHNFVKHGAAFCGKYPGEWFGPSATARCIKALVNSNDAELRVYSTGDGPDVYEDEFLSTAKGSDGIFRPTLILVGTRLGITKITPVYWDALIASLQLPQSVGIAGGRPSSSHYFIGAQGPNLFYLDPHHTRPALRYYQDPQHYSTEEVDSCHTRRLRKLHVKEMDPSMLIGFIIQDEEDWVEWRKSIKHVQGKAVIHVSDVHPLSSRNPGQRRSVDSVLSLSENEFEVPRNTTDGIEVLNQL